MYKILRFWGKEPLFKKLFGLFFLFNFFLVSITMAVEVNVNGNILQNWISLSLVGKDQSEIELYFRDVPPPELERVKDRLRLYVLSRLRSKNIKARLQHSSEVNDIQLIIQSILEETRYFSLEDDDALKYNIKEEFGINPFTFKNS